MDGAASVASTRPQPVVIRPPKRWVGFGLRELWRFRELLVFLAWRDLKVRYKQTLLGVAWAVLQPLLYMLVVTLLFKRLLGVYSVGALRAARARRASCSGSRSRTRSRSRPTASSATRRCHEGLLPAPARAARDDRRERRRPRALDADCCVVVMAGYGDFPDPAARAGWRSPPSCVAAATAIGVGSWLAALNVKYRDIRFVVPFLLQLWLFGSSVFITFDRAQPRASRGATLYWLNPMAGAVEALPLVDARRRPAARHATSRSRAASRSCSSSRACLLPPEGA